MRVAVLHYHLLPGGVTRVIESAALSLAHDPVRVAVFAGSIPENLPSTFPPTACIPELAYGSSTDPEHLYRQLLDRSIECLGGPPDLWHIHNHSLGKNLALPALVEWLAAQGHPLLLQLHDFAEDFRARNYSLLLQSFANQDTHLLRTRLYPCAPHVLYAALTSRDASMLARSGIPADHIRLLPNPVAPLPAAASVSPPTHAIITYPTRAIRRKNIGEFLLWAASRPERFTFQITLAPTSPSDAEPYRHYKQLAADLNLPVEFEAGINTPYPDLIARSTALATTSIAEGYGLAFAEPWIQGKPLLGRNLPEITRDLTHAGLDLSSLYTKFLVPLAWIDLPSLRNTLSTALDTLYQSYCLPLPPHALQRALDSMIQEDHIDVGRLDEARQILLLRSLATDPARAKALHPHPLDAPPVTREILCRNRDVILRECGFPAYRKRLLDIYQDLLTRPTTTRPAPPQSGEPLHQQFLDPEKLHLLRT
ncbi:MAG TPA: glycosyltransferase family 4 protein [Kiritimatiellia bacterium]|nr:glycosyltransferase family 4 protein [Kiritimatiellia bacterium]